MSFLLLLRLRSCSAPAASVTSDASLPHTPGIMTATATGQAEGVTEPRPSSLPDNIIEDLAPKILLSDYAADTTQEIINDL